MQAWTRFHQHRHRWAPNARCHCRSPRWLEMGIQDGDLLIVVYGEPVRMEDAVVVIPASCVQKNPCRLLYQHPTIPPIRQCVTAVIQGFHLPHERIADDLHGSRLAHTEDLVICLSCIHPFTSLWCKGTHAGRTGCSQAEKDVMSSGPGPAVLLAKVCSAHPERPTCGVPERVRPQMLPCPI